MRICKLALFFSIAMQSPPLVSIVGAQAVPQAAPAKCVDAQRVMRYVQQFYKKSRTTYPPSRLINEIKRGGYCGDPSDEELENMRAVGTPPEVIDAIEEARRAVAAKRTLDEPAEREKQIRNGVVRITCEPVDCQISMNGTVLGRSTKGEFSGSFPVGLVTVSAAEEKYDVEPKRLNIEIKENAPATGAFKFSPSRAALEEVGARMFARTIEALGGENGLKALGHFQGGGLMTCYDRTGQQTAWDLAVILKSPDKAHFSVTRVPNSKAKYEAVHTNEGLEWSKVDQKSPQFAELDLALRQFEEQQLARLIEGLRKGGFKMVAFNLTTKAGDDVIFRAEGGGRAYRITLGPDLRPREILFETGGLDKGLRVLYSQYLERDGVAFPLHMEINYPGAERYGVATKLRFVELNPAGIKDSDFVLKKKGKILGVPLG